VGDHFKENIKATNSHISSNTKIVLNIVVNIIIMAFIRLEDTNSFRVFIVIKLELAYTSINWKVKYVLNNMANKGINWRVKSILNNMANKGIN